jgi:hypothetical protein
MIPFANIKSIITGVAADIGITIIRADQQGTHPAYPYAVYKEISSSEESAHMDIRQVEEGSNSTFANIKNYEKSEATISFNFLDKNRVDRIREHATNALKYFKSYEGRDAAKVQEITVRIISPSIEDRTVYQDAFFENKIGFDVRFDYTGLDTLEDTEAIETITIQTVRDEVDQEDLTVTRP